VAGGAGFAHSAGQPVDFSTGAQEAQRLAIEMSGPETQLVLVQVWQPPYVYGTPEALAAVVRRLAGDSAGS
jgi:hypothetical protein